MARGANRPARLALLVVGLAGCWPGPLVRVGEAVNDLAVQGGPDQAMAPAFVALSPCADQSTYVVANTVEFGDGVGQRYVPACVTVHVGGTVTFSGGFDAHPLNPSTRSTHPSPISTTGSGTSAGFTFATAGYYPFFCSRHGNDNGGGMAGVVRVLP